jgi:predicted kinase
MPVLYMLVGVPGSGKSTWVKDFLDAKSPYADYRVIGSDMYIESKAAEEGKTYSEVWEKYCKEAEKVCIKQIQDAIAANVNVIWDQTNLTKNVRAKRLAMFPGHYTKYFCYHQAPDEDELDRRLNSRPGKIIPKHVIEKMTAMLEVPTLDEGFAGHVSVSNHQSP